ncbi:TonB-dependent receptor [Xanthomonas massiliensis]|uniref:TonB-dependent receptor n=1 Tax=Xanthomonas massiliensis TaxID=1720302 RepID=UPI000824E347|nr:TonB-dependent receptor [Xanthomonas massiliensis]
MTSNDNQHPRRHPARKLLTCALASCLLIGAAGEVMAQSANANLRGQVAQAQAGTEVVATNVATGSVRRTTTREDGSYSLIGLDPGTYTVVANGVSQTVTLTVASTTNLDLGGGTSAQAPAGPAKTLDTVTVTAPVLQEVRTSEVAKTISLQQIQTVPQVSRNFLEFADAVPGMIFTRDAKGNTSLRGGAQNTSSTNVYIDGVGQKSYVKEGGVAGQFGSAGNPFPQLAIGEYKVITSNYKAEYGQISSAAVTAATKSGTNEFHGEAFYRYTDEDMRSPTPAEKQPGADKASSQEKEYGFAVGGPIVQDRMHFFLTYEAKRFDLPTTVSPDGNAAGAVSALPADAAAQLGAGSQSFKQDLAFGKIDWEPTDADRFELSYQYRNEHQANFGDTDAASHGTTTDNYDKRYALRWNHSADRWYNETILTHEDSFNNPVPVTYGNGYVYTTPTASDDATIVAIEGGSPLAAQTKGQKGWSLENNITFDSFQWKGDHTIKMGAKYKDIDLYAADALDINPQFYYSLDNDSFGSDTPYKAFFTKPVNGIGGLAPSVKTSAKQWGLFIQDDWQVNDHLMLNIGLRWDYEKNPAYLNFVTPQNVIDALNSQDPNGPAGQTYAQSLALGGVNVNDYISTGHNRHAFKDAWQPRLGFSYDINADEQHVVHGGAGRAYDRDLFDYLQLETTKSALPQVTVNFRDPDTGSCYRGASPCYDWDPAYLTGGLAALQALVGPASNAGTEVDMLNNNLKVPYSDQFSLGMSNQMGDWLTDVTVSRVLSYDGFAFTLGNRYPNGSFWDQASLCDSSLAGTSDDYYGQPWGCGLPGFGSLILGNNGIKTRTTQVLLSAQKPFTKESGWGASAAYTWTNARQNRDVNEHYSFDAETIQDYPFIKSNAAPRHRLVLTGSYAGPWGITFGGKLTLATPTAGNSVVSIDPTGTNAPAAMPAGAYPGGSGRFLVGGKVWGYRSVDLQATKEFALPGETTLYARLDILNVFNFENYADINYVDDNGRLLASYNTTGDIVGVPRQVKVEVGFRF